MTDLDEDWALLRSLPSNADPIGLALREIAAPGVFIVNGPPRRRQLFARLAVQGLLGAPWKKDPGFAVGASRHGISRNPQDFAQCWVTSQMDWVVWTRQVADKSDLFNYVNFACFERDPFKSSPPALRGISRDAISYLNHTVRDCWLPLETMRPWVTDPRRCWEFWAIAVQLRVLRRMLLVVNQTVKDPITDWAPFEQWARWTADAEHFTLVLCCTGDEDFSAYPALLAAPKFGL